MIFTTKFKEYKSIIGGNVKLYLPGVTPPSGFKPSDILASIQLEGTFDGAVDTKDAKAEMLKLAEEFIPMAIAEIPTLVNNGLGYLERSMAPADSPSSAKITGSMVINPSIAGGKVTDAIQTPPVDKIIKPSTAGGTRGENNVSPSPQNPPAEVKSQTVPPSVGQGMKPPPNQPVAAPPPDADPELAKVMAVIAKIQKIQPYGYLMFASPIGDDKAYVGLMAKAKDWNSKRPANQQNQYVTIAEYLNYSKEGNFLVRHWKDISDIVYELRRERPAPITFDDWKTVMEYLSSKGWYVRTGEKGNVYHPAAYPGFTPRENFR